MSMTLELPDDLTRRLLILPEGTRNRFATAALRVVLRDLDADAPSNLDAAELENYADDVKALREALAATDAGKHRDFEEYAPEHTAFWKARGVALD